MYLDWIKDTLCFKGSSLYINPYSFHPNLKANCVLDQIKKFIMKYTKNVCAIQLFKKLKKLIVFKKLASPVDGCGWGND
jgi:hypothetical protein